MPEVHEAGADAERGQGVTAARSLPIEDAFARDLGMASLSGAAVNVAHASIAVIPPKFLDFCRILGVELGDGQRVACAVAYDGVQPRDLSAADRVIFVEMFGERDVITDEERAIVVIVAGARAGKSYVFGALRLLHLSLTVDLSSLAPGEYASAPIVAPDMALATQALRYVQGAVASHPGLASLVIGKADAAESIELRRGDRIVEIVVRAASSRGRTGRGRSLVCALFEESALFRDANFQINDDEIYKAVAPRIMAGGQLIISSTPWAQVGLLYSLFVTNHPNPACAGLPEAPVMDGTALAIHAPTLRMRDVAVTRSYVTKERKRDPENAAREFDAQFMSTGANTFFDPLMLARCVDADMEIPFLPEPGDEVTSGGDLGFSKNSSALAVVHRRARWISLADLREKKPQEGALLKPSEVCREFADVIVEHQGSFLMADGHYKATAVEHLANVGLGFRDAPIAPAEAFIVTRTAMREDRVRIPNNPRLLRQLREVLVKRGSGGTISIILPKWPTGEHGDLAVAFVLAVFQAAGEIAKAPLPVHGTPEHDLMVVNAQRETRRKDMEARATQEVGAIAQWRPNLGGDAGGSRWRK